MCSTRPVSVSGIDNAVQISAASPFPGQTCAVLATGNVECWGANFEGQLGDGSYANSDVPVEVRGLSGVVGITTDSAFGSAFSCAVLSDGALDCWGNALRTGGEVPVDVPIPEATPAPE